MWSLTVVSTWSHTAVSTPSPDKVIINIGTELFIDLHLGQTMRMPVLRDNQHLRFTALVTYLLVSTLYTL
jgi:hypothetical protein